MTLSHASELGRMPIWKVATIAKIVAAVKAIIAPLPDSVSAAKYMPIIVEVKPKNCVYITQERKLLPTNCEVAAGVTKRAVTNNAPTI